MCSITGLCVDVIYGTFEMTERVNKQDSVIMNSLS